MHRNSRYFLGAIFLMAIGSFALYSLIKSPQGVYSTFPTFQSPEGSAISVDQFKGKVVLLHFWAAWCAPCAEEMPQLMALSKAMQTPSAGRVVVLAVSLDPKWADSEGLLKGREKNLKLWFNAWDPKMKTAETLGSFQFPETYVVDLNGQIAAKWVGPQDWKRPELNSFLLGLLK